MKEYGDIFCLIYTDKQRTDLEVLKEDLVKFLEMWISLASAKDLCEILCSTFWPSFMSQLVADLEHHNPAVTKSAFVILSNLTWADDQYQLSRLLETDVIAKCHRAIISDSSDTSVALSIVQNLLISKPEFIDHVLKSEDFILDLLSLLKSLQYSRELEDALQTLVVILKCNHHSPLIEYCVNNFERFAVIYELISKSQNANCMVYILDAIEMTFHIGAYRLEDVRYSDNPFIQQVLESEHIQEKLELGSRHHNRKIGEQFDLFLNRYFD